MKCPTCGAWATVLETRDGPNETTRRRRECGNGHRFWTYEVYSAMRNPGTINRSLAAVKRSRELWARDTAIRKDPRPASEVAEEYGLTATTVRRVRREDPLLRTRTKTSTIPRCT